MISAYTVLTEQCAICNGVTLIEDKGTYSNIWPNFNMRQQSVTYIPKGI